MTDNVQFKKGDRCAVIVNGKTDKILLSPFDCCAKIMSLYAVGRFNYEPHTFELENLDLNKME